MLVQHTSLKHKEKIMARTYKPWQNRFSRSRSIASYLKRAIEADIITEQGGVEAVDSAQVQGIIRSTAGDSASIRDFTVDSAEVVNLINDEYVKAKVDGTYIRDYIDEAYIKSFLDSAYVSSLAGGGAAPTITSVTPTSYNGTSGTTITVNGTNFAIGTYVDFIVSDGNSTEYRASTTTLVSQSRVTATTPTAFSASVDPITVKVTTPNGTATASNVLTTGSSPSWSTGTNLGSFSKNSPVDLTVVATDPQSQPVTYQVKSGSSLPTGLSLNSNTGNITGTLNYSISSNTNVSTIITASDTSSNTTDRTFNWTITPTSSISMTWTFPVIGSSTQGPNYIQCSDWMQANLSTNGNFDDLFSAYGQSAGSTQQGIWWLRPNRTVRVDYRVKGASGGRNYYNGSYGGGQGRDISGSFYCSANNHIGFMVGRAGSSYYNSTYDYAAGGGGGASTIFVARNGYSTNSSYWYPAVVAAGGGGTPGGGYTGYWSQHDVWSALPLNFPFRQGDSTGGRYNQYAYHSDYTFYVDGGAGWAYNSSNYSTSSNWNRTGASMLKDATYPGHSGRTWNVSSRNLYNNVLYYRLFGGFGGGAGTWYQTSNTTSSTNFQYHTFGGGAGGYYGGYPTSFVGEGSTSSLGYTRQYPFATVVGTGHTPSSTTTTGSNNNYYGAYSYALGLETTGTYTQDGGSVAGTAPSAGQTAPGGSTYGPYWNSTLPRPTDHGVRNTIYNDGEITVTVSAA
jgi:hypothetical protein